MSMTALKQELKAKYPAQFGKYLNLKTMALSFKFVKMMRRSGQLGQDGWFRSVMERSSVDAKGSPIPWITYPAFDFLKARVQSGFSVFEFGCGGSTLWWAERVRKVVSVEHDKPWYEAMKAKVPANVELFRVDMEPGGDYAKKACAYGGKFDIIVVDGRDRVNCAIQSLPVLGEAGVLVWDNSDRERYSEGYAYLAARGFRKIGFSGMTPLQVEKSETGIFYRDGNCLGI